VTKRDAAAIEETVERLTDIWETAAARVGIAAFFEKRPAPWVG
jgi:methylglutaconyl-CoA hydratase